MLYTNGSDFDSVDNQGIKGALMISPTPNLDITLRADYVEENGSGAMGVRVEPDALPFILGGRLL